MTIPDIIIAIDGYSSTGKSSFAKLVASGFGFLYLDSGALYRGVTLFAQRMGLIGEDNVVSDALETALEGLDLHFSAEGKTCIGVQAKRGRKYVYVYNVCDHQACYREVKSQAISYTTGVPAMIGAMMYLKGIWKRPGVWNVEEFDPDPFMEQLNKQGLPWHEIFNSDLEV